MNEVTKRQIVVVQQPAIKQWIREASMLSTVVYHTLIHLIIIIRTLIM